MFTILGADGKEYGPVPASKIQEWISGGRANLQTKARRVEETEWRTLGDYPEFGGPAATPAAATAGIPVSAPVPVNTFTVPVHTGSLVPADRLIRLVAVLLDSIIGGIFVIPGFIVLFMAGAFAGANNTEPNPALLVGGMGLCGLGFLVLLGIQIFLLIKFGQTMGKKIVGIKIVTFDTEQLPGFVKVFLLRVLVNGLIGCVPFLGGVYSIVDICFIFRDDRRCIHDLIAGTKVVKA